MYKIDVFLQYCSLVCSSKLILKFLRSSYYKFYIPYHFSYVSRIKRYHTKSIFTKPTSWSPYFVFLGWLFLVKHPQFLWLQMRGKHLHKSCWIVSKKNAQGIVRLQSHILGMFQTTHSIIITASYAYLFPSIY